MNGVCSHNTDDPALKPHSLDLIKSTIIVAPDLKLAWCPVYKATPSAMISALFYLQVSP